MTTDQLLQDAIIDLQKRGLSAETRHLVDEAAQLLSSGRDIEARALIEKAQAIASPDSLPRAGGETKVDVRPADETTAQTVISRLSGRLAQDIAGALSEAVVDLRFSVGAQVNEMAGSLESRLNEIAAQLKPFSDLHERVDRIEQQETARAAAAQELWERLSASILALKEADRSRRVEAEEFRRNVSAEMEMMSFRVAAQEERIQVLASLVQDLSSKALSAAEQIDRQTSALRSMQERQAQRAAALNAVLDRIAKLREVEPLASEADAG
jgi:chromosome segregation ATPase